MKKFLSGVLSVLVLATSVPVTVMAADHTVANIAELKTAIASAQSGDTITIQAGEYFVNESIALTSANNGISFKANGDVKFTGGKEIDTADFRLVKDPSILKRLRREVRDNVYEVSLAGFGIEKGKTEFVLDGSLMREARYPNNGYSVAVDDKVNSGDNHNDDDDNIFTFEYDRLNLWAEEADAILTGGFTATYTWGDRTIAAVDAAANKITLSGTKSVDDNANWYIKNAICEIDAVGEYAIDYTTKKLYCYLPSDYTGMKAYVTTGNLASSFITVSGAENISFEGISFEMLGQKVMNISDSEGISIKDCEFNFINTEYAVKISKGKDITVSGNRVRNCSGGFITFGGGELSTLTPGNIIIQNNRITNCGHKLMNINAMIRCGSNDTSVSDSIGNKILNNIIENCSGVYAISAPGNNIEVKNNEILNVGRQISDGGAIYFGRSNTKYGVEVTNNYIHHLNKDNMYVGLYADDAYGGISMSYNVLNNMHHPIHIGMGTNAKFNHNIFIDTTDGIWGQSRASYTWIKDGKLLNETVKRLKAYPILGEAYPEMLKYGVEGAEFHPYNSEIIGNIWFKTGTVSKGSSAITKYESGITAEYSPNANAEYNHTAAGNPAIAYSDTQFADAAAQNFTLTSDPTSGVSEAYTINMTAIGFENGKELLTSDKTLKVYTSYTDGNLNISLDKPVSAARFTVNGTVYYDNNLDSAYTIPVTAGKVVEVTVAAEGLARQDMYTANETVSAAIPADNTKEYLNYAIGLIDEEINSGAEYDDESVVTAMETAKNAAQATADNASASKADIIESENAVYTALENAWAAKSAEALEITECEAVNNSTKVKVTAQGFEADTLVNIVVTNPDYTNNSLTSDNEKEVVRYTDMKVSDADGRVKFEFDTSENSIDMTGIYKVYLTGADGSIIENEYVYGTVETGAVTFRNGEIDITYDELASMKGSTVTASIPVTNRMTTEITPAVMVGLYNEGSLVNVFVNSSKPVAGNGAEVIEVDVTIPETIGSAISADLMVWNGLELLQPLTVKRVITQIQ